MLHLILSLVLMVYSAIYISTLRIFQRVQTLLRFGLPRHVEPPLAALSKMQRLLPHHPIWVANIAGPLRSAVHTRSHGPVYSPMYSRA